MSSEVKRDELDFDDLTLIRLPMRYQGNWYIICEADGEAGTRYRNAVFAAVRTSKGKGGESFGVEGFASIEPLLVHLCTYCAVEDPSGEVFQFGDQEVKLILQERVTPGTIDRWPSKLIKKLYAKVREISELSEVSNDLDSLKKQRDELGDRIVTLERDKESPGNE